MSENKQLMTIEERIRQQTLAVLEAEKPKGGMFISCKGGRFSLGEQTLPDKINVIVVGWLQEHQLYTGQYNPDIIQIPECFAFKLDADPEPIHPHPDAKAPKANSCAECPMNEWGSDPRPNSKGKACKEVRRLALMSADALDKGIANADVAFIKVPVMSVANWKKYVQDVATATSLPPWSVITELSIAPDAKSQFKLHFRAAGKIPSGHFEQIFAKNQSVEGMIDFPYVEQQEEQQPIQPKRKTRV